MTDSYAATSELAPSSDFAPVGLDVSRIDRNLRRVNELEFATTLPPLPDLVKMDLIQQDGADEDSITELLLGLDDRLNSRGDDEQTMPGEATMAPQLPRPQQTGLDQTRIILAAMTSNPAPKAVTTDAAKMFKLRAIERGMLDMDPSRVDNSWSPEFNRIRGEMAYDDYNRQLRGDRPGAMPLSGAMKILNDFTSPAGLLNMATELDLFWDFGQIGDEISSWGDKFRAWADADNPLDWARKGIDALTGPIDDIVFPVVNVALMFVGAGAVVNSARVGWEGARLAEGATMFSRLWQGGRLGRFADSLPGIGRFAEALAGGARANLAELGRASMISSRLSRSGIGALSTAGDALAEWRALRPVIAGKQVMQQGMRLGFVSAAEHAFPGYQSDGLSLDDAGAIDYAGDWLNKAAMHPGFMPLELMFAPYNIFSPGTFFRHGVQGAGTVSSLARGAVGRLGSTPGRAVAGAAVGALAGTIVGDDAGDIAKGAAIGAAGAGALPVLGRALEIERVHQGLTGALLGAGAGALLGDNPEDIALGALAGVGIAAIPNNVRRRIYNQAGLNGLDQLLRGVGHAMVRSSFLPIERDQEIMVGFYQGMRRTLLNSPDELAQWETDVSTLGVIGALAKRDEFGGDMEVAAAAITFGYASMAADWISSAQAAAVKGGQEVKDLARNKIINQLRPIDIGRPAEDIIADVAKAQAVQEYGGVGGDLSKIYARRDELIELYTANPEQAVRVAEQHNKLAGDTILQLFDQRNFPDPMAAGAAADGPSNLLGNEWAGQSMRSRRDLFADYTDNYFNTIGSWGKFTASTDSVRQARAAGLFDDAVFVPVTTRRGQQVDPYRRGGRRVDPAVTKANEAIGDAMAGKGVAGAAELPPHGTVFSREEYAALTDHLTQDELDDVNRAVRDRMEEDLYARRDMGDKAEADYFREEMARRHAAGQLLPPGAAPKLIDPAKVPGVDVVGSANEVGRVTVMRADELAKADLDTWAEQVADVVETMRIVREMQSRNWQAALDMVALDDAFAVARLGGEVLTDRQIVEMAQQAAKKGVNRKSMKKLLAFARHHGVPVSSLDTTLRKMGEDLANTSAWADNGFGKLVFDEQGRRLTGVDALERRLKQLREKAQHTAAEIDLDEMLRRAGALPEVEPGMVRLWRGDPLEAGMSAAEAKAARAARGMDWIDADPTMQARQSVQGRWFTTDRDLAASYPTNRDPGELNRLNYVDIPEDEFKRLQGLADQPDDIRALSAMPDREVVLPEQYLASVRSGEISPQVTHLTELKAGMERRGYKLVHGVEFLMPEDLSFNVPTFNDVTRRHMNAVSIGNWFGRRHPVEVQILDDRRRRLSIVKQLSRVGKDLDPQDDEVTHILDTLEDWLRRDQEEVANSLNRSHHRGAVTKTADRIKSSFTPVRLDDVGGISKNRTAILAELDKLVDVKGKPLLSPDEAMAVYRATNEFRNTDFKDMGLYAIESYLRGKNAPASFLKALGGSKYGGNVTGRIARQAVTGAAIGGIAGAATAGDVSFEERLKATLMGGGLGAVAGGALAHVVNAANRPGGIIKAISGKQGAIGGAVLGAGAGIAMGGDDGDGGRLKGALLGGGLGAVAGGVAGTSNIIQTAEDFRYGYLADGYARLRDSMRFTLSPFFDLSRYTEGLFLAQTAAPLRKANGERVVVPLNMSPRGLRSRIAKQLAKSVDEGGEGLSELEARRVAQNRYDRNVAEFNGAAKSTGDFDVDAIDSAGQWFRQVGILGFSPTDWMATAFAHLRTEGLSVEDAYREAKGMYQYGTRGRSAAELSVNFIMFPFSFQKKALGHIGKWLNDDLGRSIILHDALKTYELLDEKYNLDELWKDHVPFLQQLGRLNLFAYGISAGRLGGINSQLFEGLGKIGLNAFLPVGANIRDAAAGKELQEIGRQLLPVYNDINWMMHDVREVAYPVARGAFGPMAAESADAQIRDGYNEWNAYKHDFETYLADKGYTMADVRNPDWGLDDLNAQYEAKLLEIQQKYPAWWDSRLETPGNVQALEMEKNNRIDRVNFGLVAGVRPSPDDLHTAEMQQFIDDQMEMLELMTGETDLAFAQDAGVWDEVHRKAVDFAEVNPGFVALWNKFWRWQWGPIDIGMELYG